MTDKARKRWIQNYEEYITKERKLLDGLSWRRYIFREIEQFADTVGKIQIVA
ncbi:hypothetical protein D081_1365 [Anaerovibrio sp. JC8]|nr:hypothetical protein D081_1365 [Anaerovibrio sp. JC8]